MLSHWAATPLGQAFAEYGRIDKTMHLLSMLDPMDSSDRRSLGLRPLGAAALPEVSAASATVVDQDGV